jgi:hypothetical protein
MRRITSRSFLAGLLAVAALAAAVGASPAEAKGKPAGGGKGKDTTAPTIACPLEITTDATWSYGAYVSFTASATDNTDPSPVVVASPSSGSLFSVGTTTVTVTATDWKSNTSTKTFDVTVLPLTQTVLPPTGTRTYKAHWIDNENDLNAVFEWDITVAADGTVTGTGHQTALLVESDEFHAHWSEPLPSGLSGSGVLSGTIASDGSCQFTSSTTYWVWRYDYDDFASQRTASFSGSATVSWDAAASLSFSPDPLASPTGIVDVWHVQ